MIAIECYGSGSSGNCFRITANGQSLLLDCGVALDKMRRKGFIAENVVGALVTHEHRDHCKAVPDIIRLGIPVYVSDSTRSSLNLNNGFYVRNIQAGNTVQIGNFQVMAFELEHDVSNMGFLVKSGGEVLAYITDTYYCQYRLQGINYLLIEINHSRAYIDEAKANGDIHPAHYERLRRSHFCLENAIEFIKSCDLTQLKEVHIIHMSDSNGDKDAFKEAVQRVTGAYVVVD